MFEHSFEFFLFVYFSDPEPNVEKKKAKKKIMRRCIFCNQMQTRLKRHILTVHKELPQVEPLLHLPAKEQEHFIGKFRRDAIKTHNIKSINDGSKDFQRERKNDSTALPVMCTGCYGFFAVSYKARHEKICPGYGNLMISLSNIEQGSNVEEFPAEFREIVRSIRLDEVGEKIRGDNIILMIGNRSYGAAKRKQDKKNEVVRVVRARMRLTGRLYICFMRHYSMQKEVKIELENNAGDMYNRETVTILGKAINELCEKENSSDTITNQKSGLKINILNLLKLTSKFLIGYYLLKKEDTKKEKVTDFLQVLKHFEDEIFGDAIYDLNYRSQVANRKGICLPKEEDVSLVMNECISVMQKTSFLDFDAFCSIRAATISYLTLHNARRGGEPVRLFIKQWQEALDGHWNSRKPSDCPNECLVTFMTGKGTAHVVPVLFPPCTQKAMSYLVDPEVRRNAGVPNSNIYIFASIRSQSHASGWHAVNEMLEKVNLKGAINATRNRHRVATILARCNLSDDDRSLIHRHFGHSKSVNENVYQAAPGKNLVEKTGKLLQEISDGVSFSFLRISFSLQGVRGVPNVGTHHF